MGRDLAHRGPWMLGNVLAQLLLTLEELPTRLPLTWRFDQFDLALDHLTLDLRDLGEMLRKAT